MISLNLCHRYPPCLINVNVWSRNLNSEISAELLPVDPVRCCQSSKGEDCACTNQTNRADLREFGGLPSPESGVIPDSTFSHYFSFTTATMLFLSCKFIDFSSLFFSAFFYVWPFLCKVKNGKYSIFFLNDVNVYQVKTILSQDKINCVKKM